MGESLPLFAVELNGALKVEAPAERLSGEAGAVILREVSERLAIGAVSGGLDFPATFLVVPASSSSTFRRNALGPLARLIHGPA